MATRKIRIRGYNHAVNSTATFTFDGVEIFSGAVSAEVIDESDVWSTDTTTPVAIVEFEYNNADDTQETEHSLRIEVTAGQIRAGNIWVEATRDAAIAKSISMIKSGDDIVVDQKHIEEYIENCPTADFTKIKDKIGTIRETSEMEPLQIACNDCKHEYKTPFTLNVANFFA
jgi:hypothetical protein